MNVFCLRNIDLSGYITYFNTGKVIYAHYPERLEELAQEVILYGIYIEVIEIDISLLPQSEDIDFLGLTIN